MLARRSIESWKKWPYLSKVFLPYCLYLLTFSCVHILIVSIISFFHFLLDHDLVIIEEWVSAQAWEVVILSKVLTLVLHWSGVGLGSESKNFKKLLLSLVGPPRKGLFVFMLYLALMALWMSDHHLKIRSMAISPAAYLGLVIFYLSDYLFLCHRFKNLNHSIAQTLLSSFVLSFLFVLTYRSNLLYADNFNILVGLHFFTILMFSLFKKFAYSYAFYYLVFLVAPMGVFWGMDPLMGGQNAWINLTSGPPVSYLLLIWPTGFVYLIYKERGLKYGKSF